MSRRKLTESLKDALGRVCANCGATDDLVYHHIVPLAVGGNDTPDNMVCLCGKCHDLIHYTKQGNVSHSHAAREGIKAAKARGVRFGKKPADYERVMRMIAEHSTQFNLSSLDTETEIMEMAGVKAVCYYKCKQMLLDAMNATSWPYEWRKPKQVRPHPQYDRVIKKARGEMA